jgi:predicted PurR-regulated permease PerM
VAVLGVIRGAGVLLLLSTFLGYVLVPLVEAVRRRVRVGRRRRPMSRRAALIAIYVVVFAVGWLVWHFSASRIATLVHVSAPAAVDRLFSGNVAAMDKLPIAIPGARRLLAYVEREVRSTFEELLAATHRTAWLAVAPIVAFALLTVAPGFRRSAERMLPHGHLRWRSGEYFRDVNSALAGYVRAQLAAGLIVGAACTVGFALLRLPFALPMGAAAGALEFVPGLGPVATLVMAASSAGHGAIAVVAFLGALRLAQDYIIYPRLIRRGMHLSTPVVILSLWGGAAIGGAAGVVVAIPVAGFLSVSLRHWREYRAIESVVRNHERQRSSETAP